jgi:uncharacterized protein YndB with AHSA1/START domain
MALPKIGRTVASMRGPVRFAVPVEEAFDYLVEPRNRPRWQSSLARVEGVTGEPRVGQAWTDVTTPGLEPEMRTTELDRPHRWTEVGTWRGITATLTLVFTPDGADACTVAATMKLGGRGLYAVPAAAAGLAAPLAVNVDLASAARQVAAR